MYTGAGAADDPAAKEEGSYKIAHDITEYTGFNLGGSRVVALRIALSENKKRLQSPAARYGREKVDACGKRCRNTDRPRRLFERQAFYFPAVRSEERRVGKE